MILKIWEIFRQIHTPGGHFSGDLAMLEQWQLLLCVSYYINFLIQGRFQQVQTKMMKLSTVKAKILDINLEQWLLFLVEQQFFIVLPFWIVLCCSILVMKCTELYT